MNEARDVLRRHIMAALPPPTPPASGDAMSTEQHTADMALKEAFHAMDRLAALGWPLVLVPAVESQAELHEKIAKAVTDRSSVEYPKWVKLGNGDEDAPSYLCANAAEEANVVAGRLPDDAGGTPVPAAPVNEADAAVTRRRK